MFPYLDGLTASQLKQFYRLRLQTPGSLDDWSNQLVPANGALFSNPSGSGLSATRFAKFIIRLAQPDRVVFQDSAAWPYHYFFAKAHFPDCNSLSYFEFNAQSLYANNKQRFAVGAVFRAPDPQIHEIGIEITGAEAFPTDSVLPWIALVQSRIVLETGWRSFYMPSLEQQSMTDSNLVQFTSRGIAVDKMQRWVTANTCYSSGWALGRLVTLPADQINAALGDGRLGFGDILVTDRAPAELPVLAGYIVLEPATPNSHVVLLARSLSLPFAHANGSGIQAEIGSLNQKEVLYVVQETNGVCKITLTETTGLLTAQRRQEILDSKNSATLNLVPKARAGVYSLLTQSLTPADLAYAGGKASHFGFLCRSVPTNSPSPAIALTFDLWDDFLSQPLTKGSTLGQYITNRLSSYHYPPDINKLREDLSLIQTLITDVVDFSPEQKNNLVQSLLKAGLFGKKIRFRSSTNLEDLDTFNGAGLNDSFSGCLEDDLDADDTGPSHCDPTESKEHGVFRAIRKVYASFYNQNSFLERLHFGIDESKVGMAVLVHFSSPDDEELANGVATLAIDKSGTNRTVTAQLATQLGAESVTNPDTTKQPETVLCSYQGQETDAATLVLQKTSSLTHEGAPVMDWESDYRTLLTLLNTASMAYEQYYPAKPQIELDLEFKKIKPGLMILKQIRPIPHPSPIPVPTIP